MEKDAVAAVEAVLGRLDDLIDLVRRVEVRLEHLERRQAGPVGLGDDEVGRPHRLAVPLEGERPVGSLVDDGAEDVFLDAARRDLSGDLPRDLPGRAGAT
ncbi:hypothetical protein [Actinomycetospora lemnae]|uniref:Uncharacterized protein n=1 Tax=Actinomycetospora lemnae TaxID=3019891 RepID=A0ABT5SYK0_9PSEU|nr:hypothetical protein [Actinomycetospora sp. DW7H6]MDD7967948.1 hypothetical protein [Actinomycetospora sp. DW7H6]